MARKTLRDLTIGRKVQFATEIVEIDGTKFEVRSPSIKQREDIMNAAGIHASASGKERDDKISAASMQVLTIIYMVYDPETGEKVFDLADRDVLLEQPIGGWVDILAGACMRLMKVRNVGEEAPGKNSDAILPDSSSSV
jgi:hypothetical protein